MNNQDAWAQAYDSFRHPHHEITNILIKDIEESEDVLGEINILDIGCGTGNYSKLLANMTDNPIYCMDISEQMLSYVKKCNKLRPINRDCNADFYIEDVKFGYIFCINMLHYINDINKFFSCAKKMLINRGKILVATRKKEDLRAQALGKFFPDTVEKEMETLRDIGEIISIMKMVGFNAVTIESLVIEKSIELEQFTSKSYYALQNISDTAFAEGISKMKTAISLGEDKYSTYYTIIRGVI